MMIDRKKKLKAKGLSWLNRIDDSGHRPESWVVMSMCPCALSIKHRSIYGRTDVTVKDEERLKIGILLNRNAFGKVFFSFF